MDSSVELLTRRSVAAPRIDRRAGGTVLGLVIVVVLIGYVDYLTGPEFGFSLFLSPPVVAAGWHYGRRASLF